MLVTMDVIVIPIVIYIVYVIGKAAEKHGSLLKFIKSLLDTDFEDEKSAQKKTHATHIA